MSIIFLPLSIALFLAGCGVFFALGFAGVCRWLKWSPVNVTININNPPAKEQP